MVKSGKNWAQRSLEPALYRGVNQVALDEKGRFSIPTRYRRILAEACAGHFVFTVDRDECLLLYPQPEWETVENQLANLPNLAPQTRHLQRLLLGHATEVSMDSHGRLLVPPPLRAFARLDHRTVLIGQGNKFELWDETRWDDHRRVWLAEAPGPGSELPADLLNLRL